MKMLLKPELTGTTTAANKARAFQRLDGSGVVTTGRGRDIPVEYHLSFPKNDPNGPDQDPSKSAPKEFSGQVWCPFDGSFVSVYSGKTLTLRLADGRRLRFFHQDRDGGIAVTEWLG
ncbi:MAG TPA: hypothetical protein VMU80_17940 [Bryobacteraceae bacterium]|nr:hypothetical protein [Bryobacteraceae bacterium]HUO31110.1 hypothetical protein [Bryobacteraceae bacterium]